MTRSPVPPVSLQDLRRIAETLAAVRGRTVGGATMRSDRRQLRIDLAGVKAIDSRGALGRVERSLSAQPACVRAFFLRLASLRLRFTLGFS